ncbi:MAG: hypothetical protein NWR72_02695 [Bacteroidia bacterium]|nr:hypothetical protein [Bacteroidia bacterium]
MLVIISDLHLTDGSSGTTISQGAFDIFRQRIREIAYRASFRKGPNGEQYYEPVESVEVVLLGDVLDLIRSQSWTDARDAVRPWEDPQDPGVIEMVEKITRDIFSQNAEACQRLKNLTKQRSGPEAAIALPEARLGKPRSTSFESEGDQVIPMNLYYMVGNHDWQYHLHGAGYDQIRANIVETLGLSNDPGKPFPHRIEEFAELERVCREHRVYARHGDIYDPFNYNEAWGRDASSIGDAIVIELLNRFPQEVERLMGGDLSPELIQGLKEIDNVRPLLFIPIWIDGLLKRHCKSGTLRERVKNIWNDLARAFIDLPFIRHQDTIHPVDRVDMLELALLITRKTSFATLSRAISWFGKDRVMGETYYKQALLEEAYLQQQARFIVYGHTHHQEVVPLDTRGMEDQIYLNSGTWRQVYELARSNVRDYKFLGYQVMTYLIFYKDGERNGRKFEVWNGSLGD